MAFKKYKETGPIIQKKCSFSTEFFFNAGSFLKTDYIP